MREKHPEIDENTGNVGITPACAGKTKVKLLTMLGHRDHPRVCGKNCVLPLQTSLVSGSPPRVREKHNNYIEEMVKDRITPACAGKTDRSVSCTMRSRDHPRVCGKNLSALLRFSKSAGSPPRVREKLQTQSATLTASRITPACAGKTLKGPNEIKTFLSF